MHPCSWRQNLSWLVDAPGVPSDNIACCRCHWQPQIPLKVTEKHRSLNKQRQLWSWPATYTRIIPCITVLSSLVVQVSDAAERPVWHSASGPLCCTQMSTINVINWWPRFTIGLQFTIHLSWQHLRRSAIPEIWLVPTKHFNGSRDLTTSLSGWFAIRGLALATVNLPIKFEVSISTRYEDMTGDIKCQNGVVWGS